MLKYLKDNFLESPVLWLLTTFFIIWVSVFCYIQFKNAERIELEKQIEYVTGFHDGIEALKAKLGGMETDEIMKRYYKYNFKRQNSTTHGR